MSEPLVAVCAMARCLPDDVVDTCSLCAHAIFLRPYTAARVPSAQRICLHCWLKVHEPGQAIVLSPESVAELNLLFAEPETKSVQ